MTIRSVAALVGFFLLLASPGFATAQKWSVRPGLSVGYLTPSGGFGSAPEIEGSLQFESTSDPWDPELAPRTTTTTGGHDVHFSIAASLDWRSLFPGR